MENLLELMKTALESGEDILISGYEFWERQRALERLRKIFAGVFVANGIKIVAQCDFGVDNSR